MKAWAVLTPMRNRKPGDSIVLDHLQKTVNRTSIWDYPDHHGDCYIWQYHRTPLFCCKQNRICYRICSYHFSDDRSQPILTIEVVCSFRITFLSRYVVNWRRLVTDDPAQMDTHADMSETPWAADEQAWIMCIGVYHQIFRHNQFSRTLHPEYQGLPSFLARILHPVPLTHGLSGAGDGISSS